MYKNIRNMKNIGLPLEYDYEKEYKTSSKLNNFLDDLKCISKSNLNILLNSINSQSNDIMAEYIHINSNRNSKLFIKYNCNEVPKDLIDIELFGCEPGIYVNFQEGKKGIFEIYDGGTVYLEEISKLPLFVQYKLSDLVEEGILTKSGSIKKIMVDVKLIVSTKNELKELIKNGKLIKDLYYSLIAIKIPNRWIT